MPRVFRALPEDVEALARAEIAKIPGFQSVANTTRWRLRGTELSFYRKAWLAYLEPATAEQDASSDQPERLYFAVQKRSRDKKVRIVPMANEATSVERANRECVLSLSGAGRGSKILDYLNFYYAFTPQEDPILANLREGPTQFWVPTTVDDLRFEAIGDASQAGPSATCSAQCLALGAVWHFLEEEDHQRFTPIRLKRRDIPFLRYSGRIAVQFRDALFASDFRLPSTTGIPVLSNPVPLYQNAALRKPPVYPNNSLPLPRYLSRKELWRTLKKEARGLGSLFGSVAATFTAWAITFFFGSLWVLSALFPVAEIAGWQGMRTFMEYLGRTLGLAAWPEAVFGLSLVALGAFLISIFYSTHMDKIFNWVFRLCPQRWRGWIAGQLDKRIGRRDKQYIAQDTFRKRAFWVLLRLTYWAGYVVLAFASLQIASNIIYNRQSASAVHIVFTLIEQAALNIPLIVYVLLRIPGLLERLDPVGEGILNEQLLFWFHTAIVIVVLKGIYRFWVFTVEASPHAFYRRLPTTRKRLGRKKS